MFNDLNTQQSNQQANQQTNHQPVDDIFAETDKPINPNNNQNSNIETHRVGLASLNEGAPLAAPETEGKKSGAAWFKIIAAIIVLAILILGGYLAYSKFFVSSSVVIVENKVNKVPTTTVGVNTTVIEPSTTISPDIIATSTEQLPLGSENIVPSSTAPVATTTVVSTIDTDNDGLTDTEEATYGTNPLAVDTDSDGLSDYEEVKIYLTNPLLSDTDGDSYLDGAEVKSGYNPNGDGKMPGLTN
jgi:hypothetical protein